MFGSRLGHGGTVPAGVARSYGPSMRIGIFGGNQAAGGSLDAAVDAAAAAREQGFATFWMPQIFGLDALTALAVIGREVPDIELGTSVIPTYPRHPMMLAAQALTTTEAVGGGHRLALGIGQSHQIVVEHMWGMSYGRPYSHLVEYLDALLPLLEGEGVHVTGEQVTAAGQLDFADVETPSVLVAALGPKMVDLCGRRTDGTITWMTGPKTIRDYLVPRLRAAAERAGRPAPRVVCELPICVTDDVDDARERAAGYFAAYGTLPSYQAMIAREGASGPEGLAVIGDEASVRQQLGVIEEAGATDFGAAEFGSGRELARTRELLRSLV